MMLEERIVDIDHFLRKNVPTELERLITNMHSIVDLNRGMDNSKGRTDYQIK